MAFSLCAGCDDDIRGSNAPSRDGRTWLIVAEDNGRGCGPILVDGRRWAHAIGEPGRVAPGPHRIACGRSTDDDLIVEVRAGRTYTFDYWGP